jgi:hypothetical protein
MSVMEMFRQLTADAPANPVATLDMMTDTKHLEQLSPVAQRAWKRLESEFPTWTTHLSKRDGELEFAVPAPTGSTAGHLVAFSNQDELWVRFSPPNMCYPADDENEMVSLIRKLTADEIVFKVTMKGEDWIETTLTKPHENMESLPGHSVRLISWSGKSDRSC